MQKFKVAQMLLLRVQSDGVTPVPMEYLTNEINNAHYRLSMTSRYITVNHGYGQLYPLVKRIDYERTIQEMARETSMQA